MSKFAYGGIVTVIGLLIVFLGLTILIFCIWLMGSYFRKRDARKAAEAAKAAEAVVPEPVPEIAPAVQEEQPTDDRQLIAVIAAALAAYDGGNKRLVIRNVRKLSGWKDAAHCERLSRF